MFGLFGVLLYYIIMEMLDYLIFARRSLHKIPELFHQEFLTQKFITQQLDSFKIKYKTIKTAVIADVDGIDKKTRLAFRADMDALPIAEQNQADYKSIHDGMMHACGHDGHMAMLFGPCQISCLQQTSGQCKIDISTRRRMPRRRRDAN